MEYLASQDPCSYSFISIWIFDFGYETLSGPWRNVPKLGIALAFAEVDLVTILLA